MKLLPAASSRRRHAHGEHDGRARNAHHEHGAGEDNVAERMSSTLTKTRSRAMATAGPRAGGSRGKTTWSTSTGSPRRRTRTGISSIARREASTPGSNGDSESVTRSSSGDQRDGFRSPCTTHSTSTEPADSSFCPRDASGGEPRVEGHCARANGGDGGRAAGRNASREAGWRTVTSPNITRAE